MKRSIDIYTGWIVAFVDGVWRRVYIQQGYCTLASIFEPNRHEGVCNLEDARKVWEGEARTLILQSIERSRHALVAGPVFEDDVLDRIAFVRFGRSQRLGADKILVDSAIGDLIAQDLDDSSGVQAGWPRVPPPATPGRWDRSARSLIIS